MCGIAGAVHADGRPLDREWLLAASRRMRHRGPDGEGVWIGATAALALERLAIVDLRAPPEPVASEDGQVLAVLNGEIYNHRALRKTLEGKGHRFRTRTDTEVLVHLYEERGPGFVSDLDGMFAFAIWDRLLKRLVLARDPFGVKPLYWSERKGDLAFASELPALMDLAGLDRIVDRAALQDYLLLGQVPHPRTIWQGARKLPPGTCLVWEKGSIRQERFFRPSFALLSARESVDTEALRKALLSAVQAQLAADVEVGVLLSGGIDSGILTALASRLNPDLRTFSVGFEGAGRYDERPAARRVARRFRTRHREAAVAPPDRARLASILRPFGEPFADSSAIPLAALAELAATDVKAALTGEGGDELFGGYAERYVWDPVAERLSRAPARLRAAAAAAGEAVGRLPARAARNASRRARKLLSGAALPPADRYLHWFALFPDAERKALLRDGFARAANPFAEAYASSFGADPRERPMLADLEVTMPGDMLAKCDRVSMARSLELRVPFLSPGVWEIARRLPPAERVRGHETKVALRRLARRLLPRSIHAARKRGFESPIAAWMRGPWRPLLDEALGGARPAGGTLQGAPIAALRRRLERGEDHAAHPLYALLVFALWQDEWKPRI